MGGGLAMRMGGGFRCQYGWPGLVMRDGRRLSLPMRYGVRGYVRLAGIVYDGGRISGDLLREVRFDA